MCQILLSYTLSNLHAVFLPGTHCRQASEQDLYGLNESLDEFSSCATVTSCTKDELLLPVASLAIMNISVMGETHRLSSFMNLSFTSICLPFVSLRN